jgi:hypothetical protein
MKSGTGTQLLPTLMCQSRGSSDEPAGLIHQLVATAEPLDGSGDGVRASPPVSTRRGISTPAREARDAARAMNLDLLKDLGGGK